MCQRRKIISNIHHKFFEFIWIELQNFTWTCVWGIHYFQQQNKIASLKTPRAWFLNHSYSNLDLNESWLTHTIAEKKVYNFFEVNTEYWMQWMWMEQRWWWWWISLKHDFAIWRYCYYRFDALGASHSFEKNNAQSSKKRIL